MAQTTINKMNFEGDFVKPMMTGAELRDLPIPPIQDDHFLYMSGDTDILVLRTQVYPTEGSTFFSAPKVINPG